MSEDTRPKLTVEATLHLDGSGWYSNTYKVLADGVDTGIVKIKAGQKVGREWKHSCELVKGEDKLDLYNPGGVDPYEWVHARIPAREP